MIAYKAVQVTPDGQPMSLMAGTLPPQLCVVYPAGEWTSPPIGNVFINETEEGARREGGELCEVWEVEVNADEVVWIDGVPSPHWGKTLKDYRAWWDRFYTGGGLGWYRAGPVMTAKRIRPIRRVAASQPAVPWPWERG